jgi:hypothetical protein
LLEHKVAATPMRGWDGKVADRHVRFVFSNEPVDRLTMLGARVRGALASARGDRHQQRCAGGVSETAQEPRLLRRS